MFRTEEMNDAKAEMLAREPTVCFNLEAVWRGWCPREIEKMGREASLGRVISAVRGVWTLSWGP